MWPLRKVFTYFILSIFLLGSIYVIRFRLNSRPLIPEFLKGGQRFRTERVCAPMATILVNSAPGNSHRRQVIRENWGHIETIKKLDFTVVFGIGEAADEILQRQVDWEAATYGDVIQSVVLDEYRALPLKVLSLFEKIRDACEIPPIFVIKVDDDIFVNVFSLRELLQSIESELFELKLWCLVWEGMPVLRQNQSKWFVSKERYSDDFYPSYCSGSAYILNQRSLRDILKQHSGDLVLPFEDVYITGILAQKAHIEHVQLGTRYTFESISEDGITSGQTIFAHLGPNAEERVEHFWNYLKLQWKEFKMEDGL